MSSNTCTRLHSYTFTSVCGIDQYATHVKNLCVTLSQAKNFGLKEFADDNSKFDENGKKLSKRVENTVGKGEIAHYEQLVLQTRKNQGLFGKWLHKNQRSRLVGGFQISSADR